MRLCSSLHSQSQVQDLVNTLKLSYTELILSEMKWEEPGGAEINWLGWIEWYELSYAEVKWFWTKQVGHRRDELCLDGLG